MKKFYEITQYSLTQKGLDYRKINPEVPWGCVELTKEDIDGIFKESYESRRNKAVEYLETGGYTRCGGTRVERGFTGMSQILNEETGDIKSYEDWLEGRQTPKYFENPDFYFSSNRGYIETPEEFESYSCMYSLSEGYYYTRFRLSERYFGLDVISFEDDFLYEVSPESDVVIKCDGWEGFRSCGDLVGCSEMNILSYIESHITISV